jgi:hypothetical protein
VAARAVSGDPSAGSLVIELPERFLPGRYRVFWRVITNGVIPGCSPYCCALACIACW